MMLQNKTAIIYGGGGAIGGAVDLENKIVIKTPDKVKERVKELVDELHKHL